MLAITAERIKYNKSEKCSNKRGKNKIERVFFFQYIQTRTIVIIKLYDF